MLHSSLDQILLALESHLMIDSSLEVREAVNKAVEALEYKNNCSFEKGNFNDTVISYPMSRERLERLHTLVTACLKDISFLSFTQVFNNKNSMSLKDVNFLGFDESQLSNCLRYLMNKSIYHNRKTFFPTILKGAEMISQCSITRLVTIMGVLEAIGYEEGVGCIANYLFIGMKVN